MRPAPLGPDDLIAAYFTLARADRDGVARIGFPARVAAAAGAGFRGIGIQPTDHARSLASGLSPAAIDEVLDEHRVRVGEIDGVPWWPRPGQTEAEMRTDQEQALELGRRFGAHHLVAPMPALDEAPSAGDLADRLGALGDLAAPDGLLVAFELLPWTTVRTLDAAWEVIRRCDRANVGLTLDFWHFSAGGGDLDLLRTIPGASIAAVHITDGRRDPSVDPFTETMRGRQIPGEGEFDLDGIIGALDAIGARLPMTVEIVPLDHRDLDVDQLAVLVHRSVRAALAHARSLSPI